MWGSSGGFVRYRDLMFTNLFWKISSASLNTKFLWNKNFLSSSSELLNYYDDSTRKSKPKESLSTKSRFPGDLLRPPPQLVVNYLSLSHYSHHAARLHRLGLLYCNRMSLRCITFRQPSLTAPHRGAERPCKRKLWGGACTQVA